MSHGLYSFDKFKLYYDRIVPELPIVSNSSITAAKLETTNATPADALGTNLQAAIMDLIYPAGFVYISMTPFTEGKSVVLKMERISINPHGMVVVLGNLSTMKYS